MAIARTTYAARAVDSTAILWSGLIAGTAFLLLQMLLIGADGGTVWTPLRLAASVVLGRGALPPPAGFDLGVIAAGLLVHYVLALLAAAVLGIIVHRLAATTALAVGLAFGFGLYLVNGYAVSELFPWFAEIRTGGDLVSYLMFGAVAAGVYRTLSGA